jgi:patatin-like phospholipase/acyl hydrolase
MSKKTRKKGKLGKMIIGGAIGSLLAIALGTKRGRKKTHEVYKEILEKMEDAETIIEAEE